MSQYLISIAADNQRGLSPAEEKHYVTQYVRWAEMLNEKHIIARRLSLDEENLIPSKKLLL